MDKKATKLLEEIKKLLMLQLVMNGANSEDIGNALGIDSSTVRHMIAFKRSKKINEKS